MSDLSRHFHHVLGPLMLVTCAQTFVGVGSTASFVVGGISGLLLLIARIVVPSGVATTCQVRATAALEKR